MKHWDRVLTAKGVRLGVWMDAQANPTVVMHRGDSVEIHCACWKNHEENPQRKPVPADYPLVWKYRNIEFHFGFSRDDGLALI